MSFLIGGLSSQQYKAYLSPSLPEKQKYRLTHWIAHFHIARYPAIAILVNRIAYFILNRFSIYPNNVYLFQKFKSHTFREINSQEEYQAAQEIFSRFQECADLNLEELDELEDQLEEVEDRLNGRVIENEEEDRLLDEEERIENHKEQSSENLQQTKKSKSNQVIRSKDHSKNKKDQKSEKIKKVASSVIEKPKVIVKTSKELSENSEKIAKVEVPPTNHDDQIRTNSDKESDSFDGAYEDSEDDIFDPDRDDVGSSGEQDEKPKETLKDSGSAKKDQTKEVKNEFNIEEISDDFIDGSDFETDDSFKTESNSSSCSDDEDDLPEGTQERLQQSGFFDLLQSQIFYDEKIDSEIEVEKQTFISLPDEIECIVKEPFLLESLEGLFADNSKIGEKKQQDYREKLNQLLQFEKSLRLENKKVQDDRFHDYMKKVNGAFEKAWEKAYEKVDDVYTEFSKAFGNKTNRLNAEGEIVCKTNEFKWIVKKIAQEFPAIYHFAFDAPSLNIYQNRKMASLARAMFIGKTVQEKLPEIDSPYFIRIDTTLNKATPTLKNDDQENPLIEKGSFIYTYCFRAIHKVIGDKEKVKQELAKHIKSYVQEWLGRTGLVLTFNTTTIKGGQTDEDIPCHDWVVHVRDTYIQTLKNMDAKALKETVQKAYECPLIRLVIDTYADTIKNGAWLTSRFPVDLMNELFTEDLQAEHRKSIRQTIDDTSLSDDDINELSLKSGLSAEEIEPLVRMRVFYMICCLGKNMVQPAVRGVNQRVKTMYDPFLAEKGIDSALLCSSDEERILEFDDHFDRLTLSVKVNVKDGKEIHSVGEGLSTLSISSITEIPSDNQTVATTVTDLKDLRFSLYPSPQQLRYLISQVNSDVFVRDLKDLENEIAGLGIVIRAKEYQEKKSEYEKNQGVLKYLWATPFDPTPYRRATNQEKQSLQTAQSKAKEWVNCLNIEAILEYSKQIIVSKTNSDVKRSVNLIKQHFKDAVKFLREIYPQNDKQWTEILQNLKALRRLTEIDPKEIGVVELDSESDSPRSGSIFLDSDLDWNQSVIIGTSAGKGEKTALEYARSSTVGKFLDETTDEESLEWKIERYEDLILNIQSKIVEYLKCEKLGDIKSLIIEAESDQPLPWMSQVLPILKFCRRKLRIDDQRMNAEYLDEVRNVYTKEMLVNLRQAAEWAKNHPQTGGVEHINAICYRLYATMDMNQRCYEIFNTFLELGRKALGKKAHPLPSDPRYALIEGLRDAQEKIKAVPNDAKAPIIKQVGNSLRGHLNGIPGVTAFDPNMQSNPTHVFFTKVLKNQDGTQRKIKDIAMGSPTIETGSGNVQINPEFQGFLRHYKAHNHRHLYINNQDFTSTNWLKGNESARCLALHQLAEKDFKDTLFVVTLSQNTAFYHHHHLGHQLTSLNVKKTKDEIIKQLLDRKSKMSSYLPDKLIVEANLVKWMATEIDRVHQTQFNLADNFKNEEERERFVELFHKELRTYFEFGNHNAKPGYSFYNPSAVAFKTEVIEQMFDRDRYATGNYIPADLVAQHDLREWSIGAVDKIHEKLFDGRANLTVEEKKVFIRLFYQNLSRQILLVTEADSYNTSCKDRIDRGAASDAEAFAYQMILENRMNQQEVINFFSMMVFARAIIVRKRTIIEERLERLIETVKFMIDHEKKLKKLYEELFPGIDMTIDLPVLQEAKE